MTFSADLAWQHRFHHTNIYVNNEFFEFGLPFVIYGTKLGNDGVKGAFVASKKVTDRINIYGQLYGEGWERWASYGIDIGVNISW